MKTKEVKNKLYYSCLKKNLFPLRNYIQTKKEFSQCFARISQKKKTKKEKKRKKEKIAFFNMECFNQQYNMYKDFAILLILLL